MKNQKHDILSISDLLKEFVNAEREILNKHHIKHPTTIGTMYEGLTEKIVNSSIFEGLGLKVIKNSFIKGCATEFDIMLVEGEGDKVPYTERFEYDAGQIIAIIQVKKKLFSKDIVEGFTNLQFIIDHYDHVSPEPFMLRLLNDGFRGICQKDISSIKTGDYNFYEEGVYNTLVTEAKLPVRILWGYNGFSSEYTFRKAFVDYLGDNISTGSNVIGGFGPHNFPNLIICGNFTMMKQNGMPTAAAIQKDNWWPFFTSSAYNPTYFFLELIWTRLSYKFEQLPMEIFGEDLTVEPVKRFLDCRVGLLNGSKGWEYNYWETKSKSLKEHSEIVDWQPVELDEKQHVIVQELCKIGIIHLDTDEELESFIIEGGLYTSLNEFLNKLKETKLVYIENNKLKLLTDQCQCVILPNGKFIAADNKSGRLTRWVRKEIERLKAGND